MKTLVIFYSYTGNAKRLAQELAAEESADIAEIREIRRPGTLKAYVLGCLGAIRGKAWPIQPLETDPIAYDRLVLLAPIWAGNPPPPVNAFLEKLPKGKTVSVKMVSASGGSDCRERLDALISVKGSVLQDFEDIKA